MFTVTKHIEGDIEHVLVESENLVFLNNENESNQFGLQDNVDLCYIDPPYNTGNTTKTGFVYHDKQLTGEWLQFMEERLTKILPLLKNTGVVMVSIDDKEAHRLRVLLDKIFGEKNFIAQLVVDGGAPKNNARFVSVTHEYVIVYAKNVNQLIKQGVKWRKERDGAQLLLTESERLRTSGLSYEQVTVALKKWVKTQPLSPRLKTFVNADNVGLYTPADLSTPSQGHWYDVYHPVTGLPCVKPSRGWGVVESKMLTLIATKQIIFGKDETSQPLKKKYLTTDKDQVLGSVLTSFPARTSTHMLEKLLGERNMFNNPKNIELIEELVELTAPTDGVVLDIFAGSGTTGHAVINLNKKYDHTRKCVMVTTNENNIFVNVTLPRVTKVLNGEGLKVYR